MRRLPAKFVIALLVLAMAGMSMSSLAQSRTIERKKEPEPLMSQQVYAMLAVIHEEIDNGQFQDALRGLQALEQSELTGYERAIVLQTYGFLYAEHDYLDQALLYFEACLALNALPPVAQQAMLYSLASLYAQREEWDKALQTIEYWLLSTPEPPRDSYILIGSIYARVERYAEALKWAERAIATSETPEESWYQLVVVCYFELKQPAEAAAAGRILVSRWPTNKNNWRMLQGAYQELGDELGLLSAMQLAYTHGQIVDQGEIIDLVRTMLYMNVPFDAAELLTREIEVGRVERTTENLELLLSCWEAAREFDRAMGVIDELASSASTGMLYARKAQLFSERFEWEAVITAAEQALGRGGLTNKDQGTVLLLKGVALLELERLKDARSIFVEASSLGGATQEQAQSWLQFIDDQGRVLSES
jgi:tetratricopeptide (TPR) repeat protein